MSKDKKEPMEQVFTTVKKSVKQRIEKRAAQRGLTPAAHLRNLLIQDLDGKAAQDHAE